MSLHAVWVHGNVARVQWIGGVTTAQVSGPIPGGGHGNIPYTDIVGLSIGPGITFRGRDSAHGPFGAIVVPAELTTYFHFPIPTPVILHGVRAQLLRVFVLWKGDPGAQLLNGGVFDGPNEVIGFGPAASHGRDGSGGLADLIDGTTRFNLPAPHQVMWGIGISLGFGFANDSDVTFTAAGADFEIAG